jgi:hypothetical protein
LIATLLIETPFMLLEKTFLMGGGKKRPAKKLDQSDAAQEKLLNGADPINKSELENGSTIDCHTNSEFVDGKPFYTVSNRNKNGADANSMSINSAEEESEASMTGPYLEDEDRNHQKKNQHS